MRIFLISNMYPSKTDSLFGVFVKNFKKNLEDNEIVFSKTSLIRGKSNRTNTKLKKYFNHYLSIINSFFSYNYDLIYVHFILHHIPILTFLIPFFKKPLVINSHGSDIIKLQNNKILLFLAKILFKKVDTIVVPTSFFKERLLTLYPFVEKNQVFISPSGGIDYNTFFIDPNFKNQNDLLTLGYVSRFIKEKGWKIFLDSLVILRKKQIPFKAIIVGSGPDEKKIKDYILMNNLENSISFLGFVKQDSLYKIYNQLDLYIFPTYRDAESLGLTGIEAMTCGTPVIACNQGGPKTYIENNINGFLFDDKNPENLTNCIMQFTKLSPIQKELLRNNAIKTAQNYRMDLVSKNLIKKLTTIIQ